MKDNLIIGTRGSKLALFQANLVKSKLSSLFPEISITLKVLKTKGDKLINQPLISVLDKGFFTKEIQEELHNNKIDLAVHSLKDLPTELPKYSTIGAVLSREDHRDVFLSLKLRKLKDFTYNDIIGTSSFRRTSQLLNINSNLNIQPIRGNVDTRIQKMLDGEYTGLVMAAAGVKRLGLEGYITEYFDINTMLTAPGQAAIAIEIRNNDMQVLELTSQINDFHTQICTNAERDFLHALNGGCQVPFAAYAKIENHNIQLDALVSSLDGKKLVRETINGTLDSANQLGVKIAKLILSKGGDDIINQLKSLNY